MTTPGPHQMLPSWAMPHEDNFLRYGLLAERGLGETTCNLHIIGGLNGEQVPVVWGKPGTECFLLALSIVHKLFGHPDKMSALMAPYVSKKFSFLSQVTSLLPDGERIPAPYTAVAQKFMIKHLATANQDSLTIPVEDLLRFLATIVQEDFPQE